MAQESVEERVEALVADFRRAYELYFSGAPLEQQGDALNSAKVSLEVLERHVVTCALGHGETYTSVAAALGVTRQAVKQRFG